MSTRNHNQLGPSPDFPERGRQEYDAQLAANQRREGNRQAEEGLGREGAYRGSFGQGSAMSRDGSSHKSYDTVIAGQANGRGRLGSGHDVPAWDAVPDEALASFAQAADYGEPGQGHRFAHAARLGANPNVIAKTPGLLRGERQNTSYASKVVLSDAPWRARRNVADWSDQ
jgi:hypothetical protein